MQLASLGERRISSIFMEQHIERHRKVESWLFSTAGNPLTDELRATLLGVHMTVHDYFASHPFLIIPLTSRLDYGEIFRDVFLLRVGDTMPAPRDIPNFLANGDFMRKCVPNHIVLSEEETVPIHSIDGIEVLFDNQNFLRKLQEKTLDCGLMCIGVVGTNPVHVLRGKLET